MRWKSFDLEGTVEMSERLKDAKVRGLSVGVVGRS